MRTNRELYDYVDALPSSKRPLEVYLRALDPQTIATICADYRASFYFDHVHDDMDRERGRRIEPPLLVITSEGEIQIADAPLVWQSWAADVTAVTVPGGHFAPEEAPSELADALGAFLGAPAAVV